MTAQPFVPPRDPPRWLLRTLGPLGLGPLAEGPDAPAVATNAKGLALLAYLSCAPGRAATRERIAELLWGESTAEAAFQSLRQARRSLRKLDSSELVLLDGDTLTLAPTVACDRDCFRDLVAHGRLTEALALYRGDFCAGFGAPGAGAFERWVDVERATLRSQAAEAAARLAVAALGANHAAEALALAARLAAIDPADERAWRYRLEALLEKEDAFGAHVAAAECRAWLAAEEVEPSRALARLVERAEASAFETEPAGGEDGRSPGLRPDMVGREAHFAAILGAWKEAEGGRPAAVAVVAPAGLGKTRLLHAVVERLASTRARVASVRALPAESSVPYALVSRVAAALAGRRGASALSPRSAGVLLAINPSLSSYFARELTAQLPADATLACIEALDELLVVLADDARLALVVDDLHWADAPSAQVLAALGERLSAQRLLLVLATRPRVVDAPRLPTTATVLRLEPLSLGETEALLGSIATVQDGDDEWVALVHRSSGGSPLLVLESLRLAMDAGWLAIERAVWRVSDEPALRRALEARSALGDRLGRLAPAERHLALVLAAAGGPLTDAMLRAVSMEGDDARAALQTLELRDVAARDVDGWVIAHDALAESLVAASDASSMRAAQREAAAALQSVNEPTALRRALHVLAAVGEWSDCAALALRLARRSRGAGVGTRAATRLIVAELGEPTARREVERRLPLAMRLPVRGMVAAAALLAVMAAIPAAVQRESELVDQEPATRLVVYGKDSAGNLDARVLTLASREWTPGRPLDLRSAPRMKRWTADSHDPNVVRGRDGAIAVVHSYADSGTVEVALWSPDGTERRLTHSPGDDVPGGWSPNDSLLAFASSRGGAIGHRAIWVIDPATGRERRLSRGGTRDSSDLTPVWSPDGSRIAFVRVHFTLQPAELCTVDVDGHGERCHTVAGRSTVAIAGWLDADRLLVGTEAPDGDRLGVYSLATGELRPLLPGLRAWASRDGRWIYREAGDTQLVAPASAPELARRILLPPGFHDVFFAWMPNSQRPLAIDRVRVDVPAELPVGVGTRLRAAALGARGEEIDGVPLRWALLDSTMGKLTDGLLVPSRAGPMRVQVSAGGWRTTTVTVRAVDAPDRVLAREAWRGAVGERWRFFGEPLPTVVQVGARAAMWNRGEGTYAGGAYSRAAFPSREGLWVEAELSTRVTFTQWQWAEVMLIDAADRTRLAGWDHRSGYIPINPAGMCRLLYPEGEGAASLRHLSPGGDVSARLGYPVDSLARGEWYRVVVQLFPDGRCGVAIGGVPVVITNSRAMAPDSTFVVLEGNSYQTRILVGPLAVGRGVRRDVPWARVERAP